MGESSKERLPFHDLERLDNAGWSEGIICDQFFDFFATVHCRYVHSGSERLADHLA